MTLPTFLVIGVPRAATTWLHELLGTHPDVYMPVLRKELHFFDANYDRGLDWYRRFFPRPGHDYRQLGEATPHYLYCESCPGRIVRLGTVQRVIVLLRSPIDRAYSHYGLKIRNWGYRGTFTEFLDEFPEAIEWGRYAHYLERYRVHFPDDRMLVAVQEEIRSEPQAFVEQLARFLDIPATGFADEAIGRRVNPAFAPRSSGGYRLAMRSVQWLLRHDQEWVVGLAKRLGVKRALSASGRSVSRMDPADRERLQGVFAAEIERVEEFLGRPLPAWRGLPHDAVAS